ncbi:MAG: sodium:calcium antiporter [Desulforudis sp.]|nr:sodium:calcium antiporter [Clostridia bacterium]RJX16796.1 MAG: sodium:calcium antiporter [Desulforudis sp.]
MGYVLEILASLVIILLGAKYFTNGMEWLGKKLQLSKGAVGSVFAAVGTALPETIVPVVAILFGTGAIGHEVGVGAILGAPFMLSTVAFVVVGVATLTARNRESRNIMPNRCIRRDLTFFLIVYTLAVGATFMSPLGKNLVVVVLIMAYITFVYQTLRDEECFGEDDVVEPLYFARKQEDPDQWRIILQVVLALGAIIVGAKLFVDGVTALAVGLGVPAFIFALLIAPVATEMPEKFNSVIWINEEKDTLAMGNITGAMVFQSSMIPALGIALTPWELSGAAFLSVALALLSAAGALIYYCRFGHLSLKVMIATGGTFYMVFIMAVIFGGLR